jgi:uncharacterized protein
MSRRYLLGLDVVVALTYGAHESHKRAHDWFNTIGKDQWGICALTEIDFLRVTANPGLRLLPESLEFAKAVLQTWKGCTGFHQWPEPGEKSWIDVTRRFAARILGHRQVTEAYLLGVAIEGDLELVTFDRGVRYMAGAEFSKNVLVLE